MQLLQTSIPTKEPFPCLQSYVKNMSILGNRWGLAQENPLQGILPDPYRHTFTHVPRDSHYDTFLKVENLLQCSLYVSVKL